MESKIEKLIENLKESVDYLIESSNLDDKEGMKRALYFIKKESLELENLL